MSNVIWQGASPDCDLMSIMSNEHVVQQPVVLPSMAPMKHPLLTAIAYTLDRHAFVQHASDEFLGVLVGLELCLSGEGGCGSSSHSAGERCETEERRAGNAAA